MGAKRHGAPSVEIIGLRARRHRRTTRRFARQQPPGYGCSDPCAGDGKPAWTCLDFFFFFLFLRPAGAMLLHPTCRLQQTCPTGAAAPLTWTERLLARYPGNNRSRRSAQLPGSRRARPAPIRRMLAGKFRQRRASFVAAVASHSSGTVQRFGPLRRPREGPARQRLNCPLAIFPFFCAPALQARKDYLGCDANPPGPSKRRPSFSRNPDGAVRFVAGVAATSQCSPSALYCSEWPAAELHTFSLTPSHKCPARTETLLTRRSVARAQHRATHADAASPGLAPVASSFAQAGSYGPARCSISPSACQMTAPLAARIPALTPDRPRSDGIGAHRGA